MIFRLSTVDGKANDGGEILPEPDPEVVADLFSASAIARYGQWTTDMPSARDAEIKENAQRRWPDVAKQRRTEVSPQSLQVAHPADDVVARIPRGCTCRAVPL